MIVRAKYANTLDWRQGQRLGKNDLLVTVSKPDDASRVMLLLCAHLIHFVWFGFGLYEPHPTTTIIV